MSKTISDLHEVLFQTIENVKSGTMSVDLAKTISEIGQVMVNAAKAEIAYKNVDDRYKSSFLPSDTSVLAAPMQTAPQTASTYIKEELPIDNLPVGYVGRTVHKMR